MAKEFTVYLAGHIREDNADHDIGWRKRAAEFLGKHGIGTRDPLAGKEKEFWSHYTPNEIVQRDLKYLMESNLILACLEDDSTAIGTPAEMAIAHFKMKKPIVFVSESKRLREHYWVEVMCVRSFEKLDDALKYIIEYWAQPDKHKWDPRQSP